MAAAGILVVMLVAAGEGSQPTTLAMAAAARAALGSGAHVMVQESDSSSDDEATLLADMLRADAIVEVSWYPPKHERAALHLHVTAKGEWRDRELKFAAGDVESERGRTLGFAIAAMLPDPLEVPTATAPTEPKPSVPTDKPPTERPIAEPPTSPPEDRFAVEAALLGVTGVGGPAGGIGGELGARARLGTWIEGRLALGGRVGEIASVGATTSTFALGTGLALHAEVADGFSLGVRADVFLSRISVTRVAFETGDEHRSRLLPGADLLAEASLRLTGAVGVFAAAGGECTFGTTDLVVAGSTLSTVPYLRLLAEVGFLTRF
jgi:hypothetical protein